MVTEESANIDICKIDIEHEYKFEVNKNIHTFEKRVLKLIPGLKTFVMLPKLKKEFIKSHFCYVLLNPSM